MSEERKGGRSPAGHCQRVRWPINFKGLHSHTPAKQPAKLKRPTLPERDTPARVVKVLRGSTGGRKRLASGDSRGICYPAPIHARHSQRTCPKQTAPADRATITNAQLSGYHHWLIYPSTQKEEKAKQMGIGRNGHSKSQQTLNTISPAPAPMQRPLFNSPFHLGSLAPLPVRTGNSESQFISSRVSTNPPNCRSFLLRPEV